MTSKQQIKQILSQAKNIQKKNDDPPEVLSNYLYYQYLKVSEENAPFWACGLRSSPKVEVSKAFKNGFKKLTRLEKANFYLMNVKNMAKAMKVNEIQNSHEQIKKISLNIIENEIINRKVIIKGGYKLYKWSQVTIEFYWKQKQVRIYETMEEINLELYLIRKSKNKDKPMIILEPISQISNYQYRIICHNSEEFKEFNDLIAELWMQAHYEKVRKMLGDRKSIRKNQSFKSLKSDMIIPSENYLNTKYCEKYSKQNKVNKFQSLFLNKKTIASYQLLCDQIIQNLSSLNGFKQKASGTHFGLDGKKVRKIFKFPKQIPESLILYVINDIRHARKRKDSMIDIKVLKCLPEQETTILCQRNKYGDKTIEFLYFRNFFAKNGCSFYLQKSIQQLRENFSDIFPKAQEVIQGQIYYCLWRVRTVENQTELTVQAQISYNKQIQSIQQTTNQYIGEFVSYINEKCMGEESEYTVLQTQDFQNEYLSEISDDFSKNSCLQLNENQEFKTVLGNIEMDQLSLNQRLSFLSYQIQEKDDVMSENSVKSIENLHSNNVLAHRYITQPLIKGEAHLFYNESGHPIWGNQWVINNQGYLVNVNQEKINIQSSVLKLVVQRMGRNLLSGKSVLNMSLPIEIFGVDSNLQRLAKGYIYAPSFLEVASCMDDPVERFKQIMCFALGFAVSYIEMEKPFNPILGETYQGLIDGCPVYAEQISHHPPITSLYMIGRGFTLYGSFQGKVQMGVNSASGINDGFNHIKFQKYPGIIKFNGPPGQISGLVYGQRKLALTKKSYFIDEENRLFMQVSWGKNKYSREGLGKYVDYFIGKIVKIKQGTNMKQYKKIKQSNIQFEYGQIYGRVNDKIFYENQEIFDLSKNLPYKMQDYYPCLESDSRMRKDIIVRKARDFIAAQQAKQELQNIQRRDKKLRVQASK